MEADVDREQGPPVIAAAQYGRQGVLFAVASAASRLGGLLLVPLYTRRLTSPELGVVALTAAVAALAQILSTLSIDNAAARWLGTAETIADGRTTIATWLRTQWIAATACSSIVAIGTLLATSGSLRSSLLIIAVSNIVASPSVVLATSYRQWARARPVVVSSLSGAACSLVVSCVLVVAFDLGAPGVALGTLAGSTVASAFALRWLRPELRGVSADGDRRRELVRFGLPLLPGAAAQWVSSLVDRFFVGAWWGTAEVGRYQVAQFCSAGPAILATAFQAAWGPWAMTTMRHDDAPVRLGRATHLALLVGSVACLCYSLAAPELVPLIAPGYSGLLPDIVLLTHSHLFLTATFAAAAGPMVLRRTKEVGTAMVVGAGLNLTLNVALIPSLGLRGAAVATALSYLSVPIAIVVLARRRIAIPVPWLRVGVAVSVNFLVSLLSAIELRDALALRAALMVLALVFTIVVGLDGNQRRRTVLALRTLRATS